MALQHAAGNAAVAAALSGEHGSVPALPVQRAPGGAQSAATEQAAPDYTPRLSRGPLLSPAERDAIEAAGPGSAVQAETGSLEEAQAYLAASEYYDWLQRPPGKRLYVATLAWERRAEPGNRRDTPAYVLARGIMMRSAPEGDPLRAELEAELTTDVRDTFAATLAAQDLQAGQESTEGLSAQQIEAFNRKNQQANTLLRRLFVIIQQGLEVAGAEGKYSADRQWRHHTGAVARALAHGGRVDVRLSIPKEETVEPIGGRSLPDWVGMRTLPKRAFSTHDMTGGSEETLREVGGVKATAGKLFKYPRRDERGADIAAGGIGSLDFNGDVVLPNGLHGHILLVYKPPTSSDIGWLQIGLETTAPESVADTLLHAIGLSKSDPNAPRNPVGYRHTAKSTEATANPASSVGGLKQDKIGVGKLDTMRVTLGGDWLRKLKAEDAKLTEQINRAGQDERRLREIFTALVGTGDDYAQLVADEPTVAAPEPDDPDEIRPAPR
ncbi:hypothetical protein [Verrucosispora sp. NA02020]|uniref:hypothetical protein n=1 Tax=Verrucosispora sp. NA02020 TaxID=2742132 RepID=UPI003D702611